MGRPPLEIDAELVHKLASIHCTMTEIASIVGCSVDTLERRFADTIQKGKDSGKSSLRRLMWEKACGGNVVMMIWLSKQYLGMTEKQEVIADRTKLDELKPAMTVEQAKQLLLEQEKNVSSTAEVPSQ